MLQLSFDQVSIIIIGTISIIPAFILFKQYLKTRIFDFLLFSIVFFSVTIDGYCEIIVSFVNNLFLFQFFGFFYNVILLSFFLHSTRLIWVKTPKIVFITGILWFIFIDVLILFWQLLPFETNSHLLFLDIPLSYSSFYPLGAGVTFDGFTILSWNQRLLILGYLLYSSSLLLYGYLRIKPVVPSNTILKIKNLWIIVWTLVLLYSIFSLPWFYSLLPIRIELIFILIAESLSAYIAIVYPESMLISHAQIIRAEEFYSKIRSITIEDRQYLSLDSLVNYVNSLPKDLILELKNQ